MLKICNLNFNGENFKSRYKEKLMLWFHSGFYRGKRSVKFVKEFAMGSRGGLERVRDLHYNLKYHSDDLKPQKLNNNLGERKFSSNICREKKNK